jgi:DNA-binding NtrC family response regulator
MGKYTVMVVDDEECILTLMTSAFRNEDYTILTATSGEEALEKLETHGANLIISDQSMSSMDGLSLLKKVKLEHPDIITIMLTGYAVMDTSMDAINEAGVYKVFVKPCSIADLKSTVNRALELKNLVAIPREFTRKHPSIPQVKRNPDGHVVLG